MLSRICWNPRLYLIPQADCALFSGGYRSVCRLAVRRRLQKIVAKKLSLNGSPEQISGWLKWRYPGNQEMQISHETIYRSLFVQARGVLKKELVRHLRTRRVIRRSKQGRTRGQGRGQIVDAVSIRERPAEVEDRAVPGHWEGDLLAGSHNTHIATLVERQSWFAMLVKVNGKDTQTVVKALTKQVRRLPAQLRRSLTWDRGLEMADHKEFSVATDVKVYFCDPQSPWQRGTNENTNRLLRQYFPKGTDLSAYSQADLTNGLARKAKAGQDSALIVVDGPSPMHEAGVVEDQHIPLLPLDRDFFRPHEPGQGLDRRTSDQLAVVQ
jgi:IS30 family transposase